VFDQTVELVEALGMDAKAAKDYVAAHVAAHGEAGAKGAA
jgi:hypothetical protein